MANEASCLPATATPSRIGARRHGRDLPRRRRRSAARSRSRCSPSGTRGTRRSRRFTREALAAARPLRRPEHRHDLRRRRGTAGARTSSWSTSRRLARGPAAPTAPRGHGPRSARWLEQAAARSTPRTGTASSTATSSREPPARPRRQRPRRRLRHRERRRARLADDDRAVLGTAGYLAPSRRWGSDRRPPATATPSASSRSSCSRGAAVRGRLGDRGATAEAARTCTPRCPRSRADPDLPPGSTPVFDRALAKDPGVRPGSAADLLVADCATPCDAGARPSTPCRPRAGQRSAAWPARRRRCSRRVAGVGLAALPDDDGGGRQTAARRTVVQTVRETVTRNDAAGHAVAAPPPPAPAWPPPPCRRPRRHGVALTDRATPAAGEATTRRPAAARAGGLCRSGQRRQLRGRTRATTSRRPSSGSAAATSVLDSSVRKQIQGPREIDRLESGERALQACGVR